MRTFLLIISLALSVFCVSVQGHLLHKSTTATLQEKVNELRDVVLKAVADIKTVANGDNPQIGEEIAEKLDIETAKAKPIYDEVDAKIQDKTLKKEEARIYLKELSDQFKETQTVTKPLVEKLSKPAQVNINDIFDKTDKETKTIADVIYALCREDECDDE